ncbi:hypothetical protein F4780DRAFT_771780 [Xylariomycetidae sp. FL0641]|nr:hypothetical protein F4780DRAFT_771780 [Xylariomycetidae sp. FL0641]
MSTPQHGTSERGAPIQGPAPRAASAQAPKPPRILSCLLCQQRKVKCDRKFPCANCTRAQAPCVPATSAPRRRRRMFPERELLDRIRHYEKLLKRNNVKFEPLRKDPSQRQEVPLVKGEHGSDEDLPDAGDTDPNPTSASTPSGSIYQAQGAWKASQEGVSLEAWNRSAKEGDHLLFGARLNPVDLSTLHPEPVNMMRLWQLYLDNVNPLLKLTHTPTLQRRIIGATGSTSLIDPSLEALMFGIYCMSVSTLTEDVCQTRFGSSKEDLLTGYQFGAQQALQNCKFLRTNDRDVLTAFFLFLLSLAPTVHLQSVSSMFGIAMRLAERMGLPNEAGAPPPPPQPPYSALEAELRRRLWWALKLFDARFAELADLQASAAAALGAGWTCAPPANINDEDLRPETSGAAAPAPPQGRPTEALFVAVRGRLGDALRRSKAACDFLRPGAPHLSSPAAVTTESSSCSSSEPDAVEAVLEDQFFRFCDPETNPLHGFAVWHARAQLAKWRLLAAPGGADDPARLAAAVAMLRADTRVLAPPAHAGFLWFADLHFPLPAYCALGGALRRRPRAAVAAAAWRAMDANYAARARTARASHGGEHEHHGVHEVFARLLLRAWEAREALVPPAEDDIPVPALVADVRRKLARPPPPPPPPPPEDAAVAMFGLVDDAPVPVLDPALGAFLQPGLAAYLPSEAQQQAATLNPDQIDWTALDWMGYQ